MLAVQGMTNFTMPIPSELKSIFPHEDTPLFRRARALHAYAAGLAAEPHSSPGRRAFERAAESAFLTIAAAGAAVTPKDSERILCRARMWLAKCGATITVLLHKTDITRDVAGFVRQTVKAVKMALPGLPAPVELGSVVAEPSECNGDRAARADEPVESDGADQAAAAPGATSSSPETDEVAYSTADGDLNRPPMDSALARHPPSAGRPTTTMDNEGDMPRLPEDH